MADILEEESAESAKENLAASFSTEHVQKKKKS